MQYGVYKAEPTGIHVLKKNQEQSMEELKIIKRYLLRSEYPTGYTASLTKPIFVASVATISTAYCTTMCTVTFAGQTQRMG